MVNRLIKVDVIIQCNHTMNKPKTTNTTRQTQQTDQTTRQTNTQQTNTTTQYNKNYINISLINTITYKHNHISIRNQSLHTTNTQHTQDKPSNTQTQSHT